MNQSPLTKLHEFITRYYDLEEFRTLCFNLQVPYDDLGGEGLTSKVREFLLYVRRRQKFDTLLNQLDIDRPRAFEDSGIVNDSETIFALNFNLPSFFDASITIDSEFSNLPNTLNSMLQSSVVDDDVGILDFEVFGILAFNETRHALIEHQTATAKLTDRLNFLKNQFRRASNQGGSSQVVRISSAGATAMRQYSKTVENLIPTLLEAAQHQDKNLSGYLKNLIELGVSYNKQELLEIRLKGLQEALVELIRQNQEQSASALAFQEQLKSKAVTREENTARRKLLNTNSNFMNALQVSHSIYIRNLEIISTFLESQN